MPGKVYLVGAGPGDPGLISLKAVDCLKKAQTVVYDHLADERLLEYASSAELIYVGKEAGRHTLGQEDINKLLAEKAKTGGTVVRLKGGDPFVFGRGGEEGLYLAAANIPFEVVPGITSAIAVPAYAGIPVTHRGVATSFAVITGHEDPTKEESGLNWPHLASGVDTLVFLMGLSNLAAITQKLRENGRAASTPAALIRWGTKPEQEVLTGTLGEISEKAQAANLKPPAVFIVGEVVKLRDKLGWFEEKGARPLWGKKILVTRTRQQASYLTEELESLGAKCYEIPTIKLTAPSDGYQQLDRAIEKLRAYNWLIFTSANGVEGFFARLHAARQDARAFGQAKVVAIGPATAEGLKTKGIIPDLVPLEYRAEGIVDILTAKVNKGDKILIPRAEKARDVLPERLLEMGATVTVVPVYQTQVAEENRQKLAAILQNQPLDYITFTSSSTVTNFSQLAQGIPLSPQTKIACIGPITAGTAEQKGFTPSLVAKEYTIPGLVHAIAGDATKK
ncbi:MAG: uroporphyrinogen-III C-methyltransferase [Selenomonadaceae bacterium]|nr:uroporphyrinogen-III C-methyltransferase [Selenomonadaceae bacterium]